MRLILAVAVLALVAVLTIMAANNIDRFGSSDPNGIVPTTLIR